jgi:hypothetical protein
MNIPSDLNIRDEQSVIAHLLKIDDILAKYHQDLRKAQTLTGEVQVFTEDITQLIEGAFKEIEAEMQAKLQDMIYNIMENKNKIIRDAACYKYEIAHLIQENSDLIKQIEILKGNIQKMEDQIGNYHNTNNINNNVSHTDSNRMTFTDELKI